MMRATQKRRVAERDHNRQEEVRMSKEGYTQKQIAAELGLKQQAVSEDLKIIRKEWREHTLIDMGELVQAELEKLAAVEAKYLFGWNESVARGEPAARWCHGMLAVIHKRCLLLGLYPAQSLDHRVTNTGETMEATFHQALMSYEKKQQEH